MTMDATTGEVAGASVQIGDPITERLVTDLLIAIIDRPDPLIHALTDCGAGGLSSAVGEMGEPLGVDVDLLLVDRKYRGLAPWEVWLSEAQERMVLAVAPQNVDEVLRYAGHIGVVANDIGTFTGTKQLVVRHGSVSVVDLPMNFLHNGRPRRNMTATLPDPRRVHTLLPEIDVQEVLLALLAHPTIASKEPIIRRYDHEILGSTVVRPLAGPMHLTTSHGVTLDGQQRWAISFQQLPDVVMLRVSIRRLLYRERIRSITNTPIPMVNVTRFLQHLSSLLWGLFQMLT